MYQLDKTSDSVRYLAAGEGAFDNSIRATTMSDVGNGLASIFWNGHIDRTALFAFFAENYLSQNKIPAGYLTHTSQGAEFSFIAFGENEPVKQDHIRSYSKLIKRVPSAASFVRLEQTFGQRTESLQTPNLGPYFSVWAAFSDPAEEPRDIGITARIEFFGGLFSPLERLIIDTHFPKIPEKKASCYLTHIFEKLSVK